MTKFFPQQPNATGQARNLVCPDFYARPRLHDPHSSEYRTWAENAESRGGRVLEFASRSSVAVGKQGASKGIAPICPPAQSGSLSYSRRPDGTYNNGPEEKYWNWPLLAQGAFWLAMAAVAYFSRK